MRLARVIEVYHIELRFYLIGVQMLEQVIIGDLGKVGKLVVVDIHRKTFLYLLLDVVVYDGVGFSRTRCSEYH